MQTSAAVSGPGGGSGVPVNVRPYTLSHQLLCLTGISLQRQSVIGLSELTLTLHTDYLRHIKLSCKQCRVYRVTLNHSTDTTFRYFDPTLDIVQGSSNRDLESFGEAHRAATNTTDPQYGRGELLVDVPVDVHHMVEDGAQLVISIEFSLESPTAGLHFVVPDGDGTLAERGAHMFSYGHGNASRLWFPCIDSFCDLCTWTLEFTVDAGLTAVSCGDLIETVYTPDMRRKTFHYQLGVPTAAPNIGLAVGPFEIYVDPHMNELIHFCLPHMLPQLKYTASFIHVAFEFFEEILANRFPYSSYKQVFVDESYTDVASYSSLSVLSINLLCPPQIIDQVFETRKLLALALARQYISCFISMTGWSDAWLTLGISGFLTGLYVKKFFGSNEHRDWLYEEMRQVIKYEQNYGPIVLDNSGGPTSGSHAAPSFHPLHQQKEYYFPLDSFHTVSPHYLDAYTKKSHLVLRMLEQRIGSELLLQVFNKQLSMAMNVSEMSGQHDSSSCNHMSTASFIKAIYTVTGKDINVFCDQWVRQGGHAKFHLSFIFNRKRNTVELKLTQEHDVGSCGVRMYMGPLLVHLQELDGTFKHTLQIEGINASADLVCHSKSRRQKKKKIPLCTGEEVDMDLNAMDPDSPVLWIRLDPEFSVIRDVGVEQPDYQWQFQLRHERDVTAQTEAVDALVRYPSQSARQALTDMLENEQCFYKVRCRAALALAKVANSMASSWSGQPVMMGIFRKMFGSKSCPHIVQQNDFENLQLYFIQKAIPVAMARLRNSHGICPPEVLRFLLELFRYNDNSRNKYSDNYYRAALIEALGDSVTPVVSMLNQDGCSMTPDHLSPETRQIVEEIVRSLNLDRLLPCYKYVVTQAGLRALRKLQRCGHLPSRARLFRGYAAYGQFLEVRLAALDCLVDHLQADGDAEDLNHLLLVLETDPVPLVKHLLARMLVDRPPFDKGRQHPLDTGELAIRLWMLMNSGCALDARLRCDIVDLYHVLYGRGQPSWIPTLSHFPDVDVVPSTDSFEDRLTSSRSRARMAGVSSRPSSRSTVAPSSKLSPPASFEQSPPAATNSSAAADGSGMSSMDLCQLNDLVSVEMVSDEETPVAHAAEVLSDESNSCHVPADPHRQHKQRKRKKEKKKHKKHKHKSDRSERHARDRVDELRAKDENLSSPASSGTEVSASAQSMEITF